MSAAPEILARIEGGAGRSGLTLRGAFHPEAADGVPAQPDGRTSCTVVLLGNQGENLWATFQASPEAQDGRPDPLNRWSERVIGALAAECGGLALFPSGGPPYLPFQRWAGRAEPVAPSPLGMLVHPDFGLWHAYRGAIALAERLDLPPRDTRPSPCDSCAERPCLSACPVGAFTGESYAVRACAAHIASPAGADCLNRGCGARWACPVGRDFAYPAAQARFHMEAFVNARRPK